VTEDHTPPLAEITQLERAGYPVTSDVFAQLTERSIPKLLAHWNKRLVYQSYRDLLYFTHESGPPGIEILERS
jgi:hypothetical protein